MVVIYLLDELSCRFIVFEEADHTGRCLVSILDVVLMPAQLS